jgi:hypothetical protein
LYKSGDLDEICKKIKLSGLLARFETLLA